MVVACVEVLQFIKNSRDAFEKAQRIAIAGGGAVGLGKSPLAILQVSWEIPTLTSIGLRNYMVV